MLNIDEMTPEARCNVTTMFIKNIGRRVEANLSSPEGAVGEKIEGELEGYKNDCIIVKTRHESAKGATERIMWPFVMLDKIHFPEQVT